MNLQVNISLKKTICIFLCFCFLISFLPVSNAVEPELAKEDNVIQQDNKDLGNKAVEEESTLDTSEAEPNDLNKQNKSEEHGLIDESNTELNYIDPQSPTLLKGYVSKIPSGTKLRIILETQIDEIYSMVDDEIIGRISEDVAVDGEVVVPAGSTVTGKISEINPAKRLHKAGTVRIEFKNLTVPDGRQAPIVAGVLSRSGLLKGKYTKKTALISGATVLAPAAAGLGAGLVANGSAVGAGVGVLVGALLGLGLFAFQRGNMINIMSGDEMDIELIEEAKVPKAGSETINNTEKIFHNDSDIMVMEEQPNPEINEIDFSAPALDQNK